MEKTHPDRTASLSAPLTGGALVPKNLMLVFRGPEAVWTLMSGWTRALGSPW